MTKVGITKTLLWGVGGLLLCGLLIVLNKDKNELKQTLLNKLVRFEPIPIAAYNSSSNGSDSVVYVLGGTPESVKNRFKTAAELYKRRLANKILIGSDHMMMDYSPCMGRNLAFNEWAVRELVRLGVDTQDIEPVPIEKAGFGTLAEAVSISKLVSRRGYKSLILVTSEYHSMRVWMTFSKFVVTTNVDLHIYTTNDSPLMRTLIQELIKVAFYRVFLL